MRKKLHFITGLLTLVLASAPVVSATNGIAITVKNPNPYTNNQSWFVYEKMPGEIIEDVATIKNQSERDVNVRIYAVDATSNASGSFILKFLNDKQMGIGVWTDVEKKELTIKPDERVDIPFRITIPENATPSEYYGGIVVESGGGADQTKYCEPNNKCNTSVSVRTRIGSRIYITVPGKISEKVTWSDFSFDRGWDGKSYLNFGVKNQGNVAYEPKAEIEIYNQDGKLFDRFEAELGDSLPGTTINKKVAWNKQPSLFGNYSAKANVSFIKKFQTASNMHGASYTDTKNLKIMVAPWHTMAIGLLILIITGFFGISHKMWYRKTGKTWANYLVNENEDIMAIAERKNVSWKLLAKVNHIKAPFILKKGQAIKVPPSKD
ncbi:DUF916 domain-containing protein [Candidatus Peregrinibacteria bacterium]|nr:DUF916 domain-containing protein [Candidatus Peregrinibacteria bacterium]